MISLFIHFRKVFSFDKDVKRIATMNTMTLKAGALSVKVTQGDFLKVNPNDPQYGSVTHILVDPSCSGSGEWKSKMKRGISFYSWNHNL